MAQSFREIIGLWDSPETLATELGAKVETVRKWRQRNNIPAEWWASIIEAAKARGQSLTADQMTALAARDDGTPVLEQPEAAA
jgi:uncharacterized protein YjcR